MAGVILVHEEWTTDGGMLTAALKLKRAEIYNRYNKQIEALYTRLGAH